MMTSIELSMRRIRSIPQDNKTIWYRLDVLGSSGELRIFLADSADLLREGLLPAEGSGVLQPEEADTAEELDADNIGSIYVNGSDLRDALRF